MPDAVAVVAQRQMGKDDEKGESIQTKSTGSPADSFEAGAYVETQVSLSKGRGSPLPDPVRSYMEPRFGADFSDVRVHTGSDAIQMNRDVGAHSRKCHACNSIGRSERNSQFNNTDRRICRQCWQPGCKSGNFEKPSCDGASFFYSKWNCR